MDEDYDCDEFDREDYDCDGDDDDDGDDSFTDEAYDNAADRYFERLWGE